MKQVVRWLAYGSLIAAFAIGQFNNSKNNGLQSLEISEGLELKRIGLMGEVYTATREDTLIGYLSCGRSQGYGGPLEVAVLADTAGHIQNMDLLRHVETFSFIEKLRAQYYFRQYKQKALADTFQVHQDVNAASGATISSVAIAQATRDASYAILETAMNQEAPAIKKQWRLTPKEGIVLAIFILGVIATYLRKKQLRYITLGLSMIFMGIIFNASISLSHFGRILLGYLPDIHHHLVWWVLMGGSLVSIVIWGKNVYCHALCPFHATQMLLNKVSGINLKFAMNATRIIRKIPGFLLWFSVLMILLSSNPTLAGYEPFAMLFSLEGYGVQWYILPAALVGSLFISDFFCHYLCPVGTTFKWIQKQRRSIITFKSKKNEHCEKNKEHNEEKKVA
ncbi:FMN-binding protein [Carboxylicivirga sediminis]|uniref:FMN-binding protein n=1 Tax=Carboxylicivirga sediminis TaxID=2006564 RepID=A0A941F6U9_9BACT|nr:FMN-binding protein [Carboxylicivirga sediminis]MBR8537527.1 FMN-binding protein [Carboxylicivirga sediminis]